MNRRDLVKNSGVFGTAADLAEILGVSDRSARAICRRGEVKAARIAGRWLIPVAELHRLSEFGQGLSAVTPDMPGEERGGQL